MLVIEGLRRVFPQFSLEVPSLSLEKGEIFVLLGPTGAGKSRFLEILAGFSRPDAGRILLEGIDVTHLPPDRRRISILFQEGGLFPHLSVQQNILYGSKDPTLFRELSSLLGLQPHLSKSVEILSGGERQLVALARALMVRPRVLLLDEPFSAIDQQQRQVVIEATRRIHQELEITSIVVTHNFEDGLYLGHRLGILMAGKLVQVGSPQEVFLQPADPSTARFLGSENLFAGHFERKPEVTAGSPFPAIFKADSVSLHVLTEHEGPGFALIHPRGITLSVEPVRSSALNQLRGKILSLSPSGSTVHLRVDAGLIFRVFITHQSLRQLSLSEGGDVYLTFKASSVRTY